MDIAKTAFGLYDSAAYWILNNSSEAFLLVLFLAVLLAVLGASAMIGNRGAVTRRLAGDTASVGGHACATRLATPSGPTSSPLSRSACR
jgi:hypothetical protein